MKGSSTISPSTLHHSPTNVPMTNLLTVLPDFHVHAFTHLLPSLERASISTADLLTLDALDVAKRAQLPPAEVKKLVDALLDSLHADISPTTSTHGDETIEQPTVGLTGGSPPSSPQQWISTLDEAIDRTLGGGIATSYITEIVGER